MPRGFTVLACLLVLLFVQGPALSQMHTITTRALSSNGTIRRTGIYRVKHLSAVSLTLTPRRGYKAGLLVNGRLVRSSKVPGRKLFYTAKRINRNLTFEAIFVGSKQYFLRCGNGVVEPGELCDSSIPAGHPGACPTTCAVSGICSSTSLLNAGTCTARCESSAIVACHSADGCCPSGCNAGTDSDCSHSCGDGVLAQTEACDTAIPSGAAGSCPTSCASSNACLPAVLSNPGSCNATCMVSSISACLNSDGCCPTGCNANNDSDCTPQCANGLVELGEACDTAIAAGQPGACPSSCTAPDSCHPTTLLSAGTCSARCEASTITQCTGSDSCCPGGCNAATDNDCSPVCGNAAQETGELCDTALPAGAPGACPSSCSSGEACQISALQNGGTCQASCTTSVITSCAHGDGCCPSGCIAPYDNDCPWTTERVYFVIQEPLYATYQSNTALFQNILADLNAVVQQNTIVNYEFAGVLNYDSSAFAGGANTSQCADPRVRPHDTYIIIKYKDQELWSSGGSGSCIALGSLQNGLQGRSIYAREHEKYSWLIQYLSHELAHVARAGVPEFYNYWELLDHTAAVPFSEVHNGPAYSGVTQERIWHHYFTDYFNDPMLQKTDTLRYGALTAALVNRDVSRQYNNTDDVQYSFWATALRSTTLRVLDENEQPLSGVSIEGYASSGTATSKQDAHARLEISATTNASGEAVVDFMTEAPDNPKIYGWRDARTFKFHKEGYVSRGIWVSVTMLQEAKFVHNKDPIITVRLLPGSSTCLDSDNGEDTAVAGTMTYNVYKNNDIRTLDYTDTELITTTYGDYCWFSNVREASCVSGKPRVRYIPCALGCTQFTGICTPAP